MAVGTISQFLGLRTDTPASKLPPDYSPDCADMVFSVGGMATRPPLRRTLTMPAEIVYDKKFQGRDGNSYRVVVDINGAMWSVASDGTSTQIDTVAAGSSVTSITAYGREYMAFFNADGGCDAPRQWDGKKLYRVAQGGPGAAAVFTPSELAGDQYPIVRISQPVAKSRGSSYFLHASGPHVEGVPDAPGTTITFYYSDSTLAGPDTDLVDAFNSGYPCYVYASFTGGPALQGPYTVLVTSVGEGKPQDGERPFYYFTFEVATTALVYYAGKISAGYTANYQRTLATIDTSVTVPDVTVGSNITVKGASVGAWNGSWPVEQTPLSGTVNITGTSLTSGVATYTYSLPTISGIIPAAGEKVTVTGTENGGGIFNVTDRLILAASSGSFTVGGFTGGDIPPDTAESGTGVTSGTEFLIEPALPVVGTSTSPIYGTSTGGFLVFAGTAATISSGERLAVVFFITETELTTRPSPIAKFFVPANTSAIAVSGLPIGPPNVVARGVAFTPANGSRFFYMPLPESVNGVINGTSTVVNDNTSDTATFQFNDDALQAGIAIDIPGNNLFQQVTLDTPNSVNWFADRMYWGGGRNKVTSLINLEMDGGTLKGSANPLGWTVIGDSGAIQQVGSAPAYVVTGPGTGEISQPAAKTATYGQPIIQPNQPYTFRLWTNGTSGEAVATLSSASTGFTATATIALTPGYIAGDFDLPTPAAIPDDLILDFKITGLAAGAPAAVRDLQLIYANNPNRNPIARASYTKNPEAYDQLTGNIGPNDDNTELRAMFVLNESFHFLTARALYYVLPIGNSEPSSWDPKQVASDCGAFHANAVTLGQGWAAWAGLLGFFRYSGGIPENLSNLIFPTWRTLSSVTNVFNDATAQRVYIGTSGDMLVLDYHEILNGGPAKWTPWKRTVRWSSDQGFSIGTKVYALDTATGAEDDDLGPIAGYYTFSPFGADSMFQKQYDYMGLQITGQGPMTPFLYTKTLQTLSQTLKMGNLEDLIDTVAEWPTLGVKGRLMYLKLGQPGVAFSLEQVGCIWQLDPNAPVSGVR